MENAAQGKPAETKFYFAYGSNMDERQMANRCPPDAILIGKAMLPGFEFMINSRGVATVVPSADKRVLGIVWHINEICEATLDKREGVKDDIYKKEWHEVIVQDGRSVHALIYIASNATHGQPRAGYLEKIISAAQKNGFSADYLQALENWRIRSED